MNEWKPDRSGKFLTVVYKDVVPGDEVGALHEHPKACAMSWSNALHDVDYLKNIVPQQRTWVGLSVFEINDLVENTEFDDYHRLVEAVEAKLKERNK